VIATFVQDKTTIERGLFDEELVPEELTQVRMGKIIKDKYPELDDGGSGGRAPARHRRPQPDPAGQADCAWAATRRRAKRPTPRLIDGVRKFAMDVRELDIDLIDRINPFGEAYAILAKTMSEESLKQVAAAISAKRTSLTPEEAKDLAVRAVQFKKERGRLPSRTAGCLGKARMAEGAAPSCASRRRVAMSDLDLDELLPSLAEFAQPKRKGGARRARSASSPASRKSSASSMSMAAPRSMAKTATSSSGFMPCASTACAPWRIAGACWRRSTIRGFWPGRGMRRRRPDEMDDRRAAGRAGRSCRRYRHHRASPCPLQRRKARRRGDRQPRTMPGLRESSSRCSSRCGST
jgi:hypothetical protein